MRAPISGGHSTQGGSPLSDGSVHDRRRGCLVLLRVVRKGVRNDGLQESVTGEMEEVIVVNGALARNWRGWLRSSTTGAHAENKLHHWTYQHKVEGEVGPDENE